MLRRLALASSWRSDWAIVRVDPHHRLVLPTGAPTDNRDHWEEPPRLHASFKLVVERIRFLAGHDLSSMMVLSDFLSRCITPLQSHVCPTWQYTLGGGVMPHGLSAIMGPTRPQTCRGHC
jgi:hypothetical protein